MSDEAKDQESYAQDRRALLKNLNLTLKSLLSSSEGNSDTVLESSVPLDNFCLSVEAILRYGFRGRIYNNRFIFFSYLLI